MTLEILYQDEWLVAVNKPSGWLVHRSWLNRDEKVVIMQTVRDQIGQHVFTAHRLDWPTSGVLLMGFPVRPGACWRSSLNSTRSRNATTPSCVAG